MSQRKLDELIWHTVLLDVHPNIRPSCLSVHTHTHTHTDIWRKHSYMHIFIHTYLLWMWLMESLMNLCVCVCALHPYLLASSSLPPLPSTPLLSGGQFLAPILSRKPSWVARLCVVKNVRPSVPPPRLCRAIFKGSKVWRHRLAAWQPCPRIPTLCQPWTGTITWARLTNTLAVHVPFSCLICASQRQRNSLRNFTWRCFAFFFFFFFLPGYS